MLKCDFLWWLKCLKHHYRWHFLSACCGSWRLPCCCTFILGLQWWCENRKSTEMRISLCATKTDGVFISCVFLLFHQTKAAAVERRGAALILLMGPWTVGLQRGALRWAHPRRANLLYAIAQSHTLSVWIFVLSIELNSCRCLWQDLKSIAAHIGAICSCRLMSWQRLHILQLLVQPCWMKWPFWFLLRSVENLQTLSHTNDTFIFRCICTQQLLNKPIWARKSTSWAQIINVRNN